MKMDADPCLFDLKARDEKYADDAMPPPKRAKTGPVVADSVLGQDLREVPAQTVPCLNTYITNIFSFNFSIPNQCSVGVESLLVEHGLKKNLVFPSGLGIQGSKGGWSCDSHVPRLQSTGDGCARGSMASCRWCIQRQQVVHYPIQVWGGVLSKHDTGLTKFMFVLLGIY